MNGIINLGFNDRFPVREAVVEPYRRNYVSSEETAAVRRIAGVRYRPIF